MVEFSSYVPGTPCWVDLMTSDVEGSKAFYSAVFGWEAEDQFDDDGARIYTSLRLNGKDVAGMGGLPPGAADMPSVWNSYVAVERCEDVTAKVTAAGGTVMMPPMDVMDAGRMAVLADPMGAVISIWEAKEHIGAQLCNEPNTWAWNELLDRDISAAKTFYSEVFGWEYDTQDMGPMGEYTVIQGGESGLGGMMAMPADMPDMVPNHWMVYFTVADLDLTMKAVTANGGMVAQGPIQAPGVGVLAVIHDPAGASFSVMQPAS